MSQFDFPLSQLPRAEPLRHSHAATQIEAELKELFGQLFEQVAPGTFDAMVLGAPHLGSFEQVRRMMNHDGLVLLQGSREEAATRYLYRAWRSGDVQKRGLHFVRTYLQMLFPGEASVQQLWHDKRYPYGSAFISNEVRDPYWYHFLGEPGLKLGSGWKVGRPLVFDQSEPPVYAPDEENLFLTSRIEILLGLESLATGENRLDSAGRSAASGLLEVVRAVIPARFVPIFRFWLRFVLAIQVRSSVLLSMFKESRLRYPWCGRVITASDDAAWRLGRDGELVRLPLPMGSFKLGQRVGAKSAWKLKGCRVEGGAVLGIPGEGSAYRLPKLGERLRRLDGSWALGGRAPDAMSEVEMRKRSDLPVAGVEASITYGEQIRLDYPATPKKLGAAMKLGQGLGLGGQYQLRQAWAGQKLDGSFRIASAGVRAEQQAEIHVGDSALAARPYYLGLKGLKLGGAWSVGGRLITEAYAMDAHLDSETHPLGAAFDTTTFREQIDISYPGATRIGRLWQLGRGWRLDGGIKLGSQHEARKLGQFKIGQPGVTAEQYVAGSINGEVFAQPFGRLQLDSVRKLRSTQRALDGSWRLGAYTRIGRFKLDGTLLRTRKMTHFPRIGSFKLSRNEFAGFADLGEVRRVPLNGAWRVGARSSQIEFSITVTRD